MCACLHLAPHMAHEDRLVYSLMYKMSFAALVVMTQAANPGNTAALVTAPVARLTDETPFPSSVMKR